VSTAFCVNAGFSEPGTAVGRFASMHAVMTQRTASKAGTRI
jgi:hypothetical protein